ncbi:Archaic Translocase of outer membrane 14 kDa subunit [Novymonas esmeraldas]|uniref:Archaic Translocase of outer membrane 14 kDa subunit n=1 Tax=Novymonas esmeraldas TaxID=1808958 RepID=A0AAW0ELM5_9TRYP
MSSFLEKLHVQKALSTTIGAVQSVWGWTQERLWPIYSSAVFLSVFYMIAVASEKQTLADHYYGSGEGKFDERKEELVRDAKTLFNEEVSVAVKEHVWLLPQEAFRREHNSRLGTA